MEARVTFTVTFWGDNPDPQIDWFRSSNLDDESVFGPYVVCFELPEEVEHEMNRRKRRGTVKKAPHIKAEVSEAE